MPKEIVEVDQHVNHFLPLIAFGWTVIAFLLGHFMGHRSAINRDKRKEFNETVEPLLEYYEEYLIQLKESGYYITTEFPILAMAKIARRLPRRRRKKFNRLVNDIITLGKLNNENEKHILIIKVKEICNLISLKQIINHGNNCVMKLFVLSQNDNIRTHCRIFACVCVLHRR